MPSGNRDTRISVPSRSTVVDGSSNSSAQDDMTPPVLKSPPVAFPSEERRHYQRATLARPYPAHAGVARVYIVDLSLSGARIVHQGTLPPPGRECVLSFELLNGSWRRTATTRPEQPANGFTISATEDREHIEMLCHTFANSDEPGRRLIKLMAELSISQSEGVPTRRYTP